MAIDTSTNAAIVCTKVQIAFTTGGAPPVPSVKARTAQHPIVGMKKGDRR